MGVALGRDEQNALQAGFGQGAVAAPHLARAYPGASDLLGTPVSSFQSRAAEGRRQRVVPSPSGNWHGGKSLTMILTEGCRHLAVSQAKLLVRRHGQIEGRIEGQIERPRPLLRSPLASRVESLTGVAPVGDEPSAGTATTHGDAKLTELHSRQEKQGNLALARLGHAGFFGGAAVVREVRRQRCANCRFDALRLHVATARPILTSGQPSQLDRMGLGMAARKASSGIRPRNRSTSLFRRLPSSTNAPIACSRMTMLSASVYGAIPSTSCGFRTKPNPYAGTKTFMLINDAAPCAG